MNLLQNDRKTSQEKASETFTYALETSGLETAGTVKIPALVLPLIIESAVETSMLDQPAGQYASGVYIHLHIPILK
ncbi:MAG: hypothetical protein SH848_18545 [Saprospiraceae bacterium]|nr:hypothetical protein [Saprospiraceae bacterium]